MKRPVFNLIFAFILLSCGGTDDSTTVDPIVEEVEEQNEPEESTNDFTISSDGNLIRNTNIELPSASTLVVDDMTISSIFTVDTAIENNKGEVELFNESSFELLFLKDKAGEILMLSYVNPIDSEPIVISAETTAIALVLMHPWTFEMSAENKQAAVEQIKKTAGFDALKTSVENHIANGKLDVSGDETLFTILTQFQASLAAKEEVNVEPLRFTIENGTISVLNYKSSASYGVGLYDENDELLEHKLSAGLEKSRYIEYGFTTGAETEGRIAEFNIPGNGQWTLKGKSGLSFDGSLENQQAAFYNTGQLALGILGIFSDKLKKLAKNYKCIASLGQSVYNGTTGTVTIADRLKLVESYKITRAQFSLDVMTAFSDGFSRFFGVIDDCVGLNLLKGGINADTYGINFEKLNKILGFWANSKSAFDTGALLGDWLLYNKEVEFCFIKNGEEIYDCLYLTVVGDLDFGDVGVNRKSIRTVELLNKNNSEIKFYGAYTKPEPGNEFGQSDFFRIEGPETSIANPISIMPNESIVLEVSCTPTELKEYTSEVILGINSNFDNAVNGFDYSGIIETKANAIINKVSIAPSVINTFELDENPTLSYQVTNNSPNDLHLSWVSESQALGQPSISKRYDPLDYYEFVILKGETKTVSLETQAEFVHNYSGTVTFSFYHLNGTGNGQLEPEEIEGNVVNYSIDVTGDAVTTTSTQIDFSSIQKGSTGFRSFNLTKKTFDPLSVTISLPYGFEINGGTTLMEANNQNFQVLFKPTEAIPYSGIIKIQNNYNDTEVLIPVSGLGVE